MMNKIFALAAVTATTTTALVAPDSLTHSLTHSDVDVDKFEKRLGFGRQHLQRRQHGHKALRADACQNVTELRFSQAVQDNFAPIEEQSHWVAPGQRYWVNEELWGGAGFPIFVFIGGELRNIFLALYECMSVCMHVCIVYMYVCKCECECECDRLCR